MVGNKSTKGIFFPPKYKRLSKIITIRSPSAFRKSIRTLKKNGITRTEQRALVLARTRAAAQLRRTDLSPKERAQMRAISEIRIPSPTRK